MKKKNIIINLFYLAAPLLSGQCKSSDSPNHRNVLVILVDDLGWSDLSSYGSRFYDSPNIDKLADEGVKFANGYAMCPVSSPSRASIQTGKYPTRTGITDWIRGHLYNEGSSSYDRLISAENKFDLDLSEKTVAEVMKDNGYKTFFAGKWHLGETEEYWPEHQGYDINKGGWSAGMPQLNKQKGLNGFFTPYGNPRLEDGPSNEYLPERLTKETMQFIETNKDQPFFVFLSYYLVHVPLQARDSVIAIYEKKRASMGLNGGSEFLSDEPWMQTAWFGPENYKERIVQSNPIYAAMIKHLDDNVGKIIRQLEELSLSKNTLVIFTSDNGGLSTAQGSVTTNEPLRKGKGWLYEGGIRVPFIIKDPGNRLSGSTSDLVVTGMDIYPTVLKYAGIDYSDSDIDGIEILSSIRDNTVMPERPIFWHYPHYSGQGSNPGSAVRYGKYKLIDDFETGKVELYNLLVDIGEKNNIASENQKVCEQLYKMLEEWRKETNAKEMKPNPDWNGIVLP